LRGVVVTLSDSTGQALRRVQTDSNGSFRFEDVPDGDYVITPSFPGLQFTPPARAGQVRGSSSDGINFVAYLGR
jgi:hypothetical protein